MTGRQIFNAIYVAKNRQNTTKLDYIEGLQPPGLATENKVRLCGPLKLSKEISADESLSLKKGNLIRYCNQTTLHGWSYLTNENEQRHKALWLLVITFGCFLAGYLAIINCIEFMTAAPVTNIETTTAPLQEIGFPSVVICNINQVQASVFKQIGKSVPRQPRDSPVPTQGHNHGRYCIKFYMYIMFLTDMQLMLRRNCTTD